MAGIDLAELEKLCGLQCTDGGSPPGLALPRRTIERPSQSERNSPKLMDAGGKAAKGKNLCSSATDEAVGGRAMRRWASGSAKIFPGQVDEIRHRG